MFVELFRYMIYQSTLHPTFSLTFVQQAASSGSFKSGDGPDSFRRRRTGASRTSPTSATVRASWPFFVSRWMWTLGRLNISDVKKKQWKGKAWQLFLVDVSKMHITPYITWSYCFEIATQSDPLFFWILESQGRFFWSAGDWRICIYTPIRS